MDKDFLKKEIILENERVSLIPFNVEDAEKLRPIVFDDTIWKFMGMYVKNEEDFQNYINDTLLTQGKTSYAFIVFDKMTNDFAGSTRFGNVNYNSEKLEIGWTWYGKKFQGTGLNKAVKRELLQFCFEKIEVRRVQIWRI